MPCRVLAPLLTTLKERLSPQAAVQKLNERVKKIGKVNSEIADWLQVLCPGKDSFTGTCLTHQQERRKVEDLYVASLRKLAKKPLPETGQDLGLDP